jgi:long-chain fatty acid transport protein
MGGAFTGQADDPTAIFYNPAGIVQLDGTQASVGFTAYLPDATFRSNGTSGIPGTFAGQKTDLDSGNRLSPYGYFTHKLTELISFGVGAFSNFGLSTEWPEQWEGRFIPNGIKADIKTYSINPVLAIKASERLTLSIGPVLQYVSFKLQYDRWIDLTLMGIPLPPMSSRVKLTGDDADWGWNVGLLYKISDNLKFGASYRSEISHSFDDIDVSFEPQAKMIGLKNARGSSSFKTPAMAFLGVAWSLGAWTLACDAYWTEWSTFDKLSVTYNTPVAGASGFSIDKDWRDTWSLGFGVQYNLNQYIDLRAGYIFDQSPVPDRTLDPTVFPGDSQLYCIGLGFKFDRLSADLAYT